MVSAIRNIFNAWSMVHVQAVRLSIIEFWRLRVSFALVWMAGQRIVSGRFAVLISALHIECDPKCLLCNKESYTSCT